MDWLADAWLYNDGVPIFTPIHVLQTGIGVISYPTQPVPLVMMLSVPVFNVAANIGDPNLRAMTLIGAGAAWYFTESYLAMYAGGTVAKMLYRWRGGNKDPMNDAQ